MTKWKMFTLIVLPFLAAAGIVGLLLLSSSPDTERKGPFEKVAIDTASLREVFFETNTRSSQIGNGTWALQYSIDITARQRECESLLTRKTLYRTGDARSVADNAVVSTPRVLTTRSDHTLILNHQLEIGHYTLIVTLTCQVDEWAVSPVAAAPVCFNVDKVEPGVIAEQWLEARPCPAT